MHLFSRSMTTLVGAALFLTASICFAQATKPVDLKTLQDAYAKAIQKVEADSASAAQALPANYIKEIQKIQQAVQKAGNLEGLTTANRELERFKAEQTIPDQPAASTPDAIKKLQVQYKAAAAKNDLEKNKKIVSITKLYVENLTSLQISLTKFGKINEALEVKAETKRIKEDSKVTTAESTVAAAETNKQASKTGTDPIVGTWRWFNSSLVTCRDDGSCESSNNSRGTWKKISSQSKDNNYEFKWDGGAYVDNVTLSTDGKKLTGKNQMGMEITGDRVEQ
jgi:hypothetical protein